jgi:hypothetical protein
MARAAGLLGIIAVAAGLASCSAPRHPSASAPSTQAAPAPTVAPATTTAAAPSVSFTIGTTDLQAIDAPAELSDTTRAGVLKLLDGYLATAVVGPLRSGEPAGDLSGIFTGPALDRANGPDHGALVDDGMPKADSVRVGVASADLTALIQPGSLTLLAATIHVAVSGTAGGGPVAVDRTGDLELSLVADAWKVSGYDVRVTRTTAGGATTTTAAVGHP